MADRRKVILDTDIGTDVDDAIALTFGVKSPEIELLAVTTASGDAPFRAKIAKKMLRLLGREDVPVAAGVSSPLLQQDKETTLGHEGQGILEPGEEVPGISSKHAVDLMRALVGASEEKVTVICIGAVSNLALLLILAPELKPNIEEIVLMGGALRPVMVGGAQIPSHYETNFNNDPHAAGVVLRSGAPIRVVPAEVTFKAILHKESVERIRAKGSPAMTSLAVMCDIFHGFIAPFYEELGVDDAIVADMSVLLHDPLAFSAIINPGFLTFEKARINLVTGDDGKLYTVPHGEGEIPIEVAVDADYDGFERFLMERILAD